MAYHKCASIYGTNNSAASVQTASGAIANFNTKLAMPLKSLEIDVNATQDLHGQSGPYPAGGSAQKWDEEWESGAFDITTGADISANDQIRAKNKIPVIPGETYFVNAYPALWIIFYDKDENVITSGLPEGNQSASNCRSFGYTTISHLGIPLLPVPANCYFIRFYCQKAYGTTYKNDISINYPATDTAYHPYSNICPISGVSAVNVIHTGANLWDEEWENGTFNTTTGVNINNSTVNLQIRSKNLFPILPNVKYYFHAPTALAWIIFYDADKNVIANPDVTSSGGTSTSGNSKSINKNNWFFVSNSTVRYMRFYMLATYGSTYNNDISINYPSTDTEYHAYEGNTYNILFPPYSENEPYFEGLLAGTHGFVDLGSLNWEYQTNYNCWRHNGFTSIKVVDNSIPVNAISEKYKVVKAQGYTSSHDNFTFCVNANKDVFCDNGSTTVSPTGYLIYELAEPVTPTITPEQYQTLLRAFAGVYYGGHFTQDKDGHRRFEVRYSNLIALNTLAYHAFMTAGGRCFYAELPNGYIDEVGSGIIGGLCTVYSITERTSYPDNLSCRFYSSPSWGGFSRIGIRDDNASEMTETEFKNYVTGYICYQIKTPFAIDLLDGQPIKTLPGVNNIYTDTGDTKVSYKKLA